MRTDSYLFNAKFNDDEILNAIKNLKKDKAPGPDSIHPRIIVECAEQITEALKIIFQQSFDTGIIPTEWKRAHITALFKSGDKAEPGNYRPVSLTCIVGKLMESILRERIMCYLKDNNLLSNRQFGFINGRSTTVQLIKVIDYLTKEIEDESQVDMIYFDFKKAFDKVPHKRLIEKVNIT